MFLLTIINHWFDVLPVTVIIVLGLSVLGFALVLGRILPRIVGDTLAVQIENFVVCLVIIYYVWFMYRVI
jgi:hypothetical protein